MPITTHCSEGEEDAEEEEGEEEGGSKKKRGGGGFGKDCCLSEEMQAFLGGVRKMSRSQVRPGAGVHLHVDRSGGFGDGSTA